MNLLASERITWTVPAPAWARNLAKEYGALQAQNGNLNERQKARGEEILLKLPPLTVYRLTFVSVTISEEGERDRLLKDVRQWFEETYQITPGNYGQWFYDKMRNVESEIEYAQGDELPRDEINRRFALIQDIADWATVITCLHSLEQNERPMLPYLEPDLWKEIEIPGEWKHFQKFIKLFPRGLLAQCTQVCNDLNPGVWRVEMDDEAKNFGGVNGPG